MNRDGYGKDLQSIWDTQLSETFSQQQMHMQDKRDGKIHLSVETLRGTSASQHWQSFGMTAKLSAAAAASVCLQSHSWAKQVSVPRGSITAISLLLKGHQIQTIYNIYRNNF